VGHINFLHKKRSHGWYFYPPMELLCNSNDSFVLEAEAERGKELGVYLHIPFCPSKCKVCFVKNLSISSDKDLVEKYLESLKQELKVLSNTPYIRSLKTGMIYIGGGTPSFLSASQLVEIILACKSKLQLTKGAQITVEGNSSSFDEEKLLSIYRAGANRISIGVQTFDEKVARLISLPHKKAQIFSIVESARRIGFDNINIDLMYNLPGQTFKVWRSDLKEALQLNLDSMTLYFLNLHEGTPIVDELRNSKVPPIGGHSESIKMFKMATEMLQAGGFIQESFTDFVKKGKEGFLEGKLCSHGADILGIGAGAFGYLNNCLYQNETLVQRYIERIEKNEIPRMYVKRNLAEEEMYRFVYLGLRSLRINKEEFKKRFGVDVDNVFSDALKKLKKNKMIDSNDNEIWLTAKGILWGGNVCGEFFPYKLKTKLESLEQNRKPILVLSSLWDKIRRRYF